VYSGLVPHATGFGGAVEKFLQLTEERGAQPLLVCCVTEKVPRGAYYHNVYGVCRANPTAYDATWSQNMWDLSVRLSVEGGARRLKF
jgi:predicted SpoU family rRNA methylase